jgi:hypothetical protein
MLDPKKIHATVLDLVRFGGPEDGCDDPDVLATWAIVQPWAFGKCDTFATALHELSGKPLCWFSQPMDMGSKVCYRTHAFVVVDSSDADPFKWIVADVGGVRAAQELVEPYWNGDNHAADVRFDVAQSAEAFWTGANPPLSEAALADARRVASACFYLNDLTGSQASAERYLQDAQPVRQAQFAPG